MKISIAPSAAVIALAASLASGAAQAQVYGVYTDHQVDLANPLAAGGANVTDNAWVNLSAFAQNGIPGVTGTPGFPGTGAWAAPIASQVDTAIGSVGSSLAGAGLNKVADGAGGGPYAASSGLYFGGFSSTPNTLGGTLRITDATPLAGLQTVALQVGIGEAWTYDFYNHALPTLSYTTASGTTSGISASFTQTLEQFFNGTVSMPTGDEPVYINQYGLQWDLSGVSQPITSFSIDFTGVQHSQLYGATLSQADLMNQVVAVPEPGTYALMLAGLAGVGFVAARRRNAANA
jgi:hypothetical protein